MPNATESNLESDSESDSESDELDQSVINKPKEEEKNTYYCFKLLVNRLMDVVKFLVDFLIKFIDISFHIYSSKINEHDYEEEDTISDDLNENKNLDKKYYILLNALKEPLIAKDYLSLYYYSAKIAFDRHRQCRKMVTMYIFAILNITIIIYDIIHLVQDYSDYLLVSIIIRIILFPPLSYFNFICTIFYYKSRDKTIRYINYWSFFITILVVVVAIVGIVFKVVYKSKYRINNLDYSPLLDNITIVNENSLTHPICETTILGVSAFDSFGYALGGFDVKRNKNVFDNQMKTLFGENYSSHISYSIYELDKDFLILKYYDSAINTTIFSFRGYYSGPEIALQIELFVSKYVLPWFEDVAPLLEQINDFWLSFYTDFFQSFGLRFFENRNLMVNYVKKIVEIYSNENYQKDKRVIFTGINTGGVIAKLLGTLLQRKSIAFISFPIDMDVVQNRYHFDDSYMNYITNVFKSDGIFSMPDGDHTINIAIDVPPVHQSKYCSSDFCEVFSRIDNIYRTFCTMSEICGKGNQFNNYCKTTIGEKNIEIIRDSLKEDDE